MSRSVLRILSVCFLALLLGSLAGYGLQAKTVDRAAPASGEKNDASTDTYRQLTLFADVLERTRSDYVDEVTDEKLIENAINDASACPHSGFINKKSIEDMQTNKANFGAGHRDTMETIWSRSFHPHDTCRPSWMQPGRF
jgi:carboxyl-terminal processing protease